MRRLIALLIFLSLLKPLAGWATTVMVMSLGNGKAQVIINNAAVRTLAEGQTSPEGVTLVSANPKGAVLIVDGQRMNFGLGSSTVSRLEIAVDAGGKYMTTAYINGLPVLAQIDTGANTTVINRDDASRMGIDLSRAPRVRAYTANGQAWGYRVVFRSVQVGEIVINNVEGNVTEGGRSQLSSALIGQTFLKHVDLRQSGGRMELTRPNY